MSEGDLLADDGRKVAVEGEQERLHRPALEDAFGGERETAFIARIRHELGRRARVEARDRTRGHCPNAFSG